MSFAYFGFFTSISEDELTSRPLPPHSTFLAYRVPEAGLRLARLCCANPVRDSSRESSMVAGVHEQTHISDLQDQELASL